MFLKKYQGETDYFHGKEECTGILLVNLGTPDAPDRKSVKRYLAEFLGDPRVVEIPRPIWLMILHGIILTKRPPVTAKLYESVWMDEGSPLLVYTKRQQMKLQGVLQRQFAGPVETEVAMRYGNPSVKQGLQKLREKGARRILVFPLYPQYSATTTATVFDAVSDVLKRQRWIPELRFINHYHDHPQYINALAESVEQHWREHGRGRFMVMSFHGLPQRNLHQGDPYHCECHKTARLLAEKLNLADDKWMLTFQSRFGKAQWLQPYTDKTLESLPGKGIKEVDIMCPGFSSDCLETLEEIQGENREVFEGAGGKVYHYIPALNDHDSHIDLMADLVKQHTQGWPETSPDWNANVTDKKNMQSQENAKAKGAKL